MPVNKVRPVLQHLLPVVFFLILWQITSLFFSPLVLPSVPSVARRMAEILCRKDFLPTVATTLLRLIAGLGIGIAAGSLLGLLCGLFPAADAMFSPFIGILQAMPPVCWVVLALVWFGFNGKPCVFLVATATIPTMVINLSSGIRSVDPDLVEMAQLFHFSKPRILRYVLLPSVRPYFRSALEIVIGTGWKLVVMGEVLTTSSGIGGAIMNARLNIEPDAIIAWAVILVVSCFVTQKLLRRLARTKEAAVC